MWGVKQQINTANQSDKKDYQLPNILSSQAQEAISKFQYYSSHTIPEIFAAGISGFYQKPRWAKGRRNIIYGFASSSLVSEFVMKKQSIISSVRQSYFGSNGSRINADTYTIKHQIDSRLQEIVELIQSISLHVIWYKKDQYEVYVVHRNCDAPNCASDYVWQYFVEKYTFETVKTLNGVKWSVGYCMICSFQDRDGYFSFVKRNDKLKKFVTNFYCKGDLANLEKIQGLLIKKSQGVLRQLQLRDDPAYDNMHRRQLRLLPQHYKNYVYIKKTIIRYIERERMNYLNESLGNQHDKTEESIYEYESSPNRLTNLICRYFQVKEYKLEETITAVQEYLSWYRRIVKKYKYSDFYQITTAEIFTYLGEDYKGRVVVLNRASRVMVDELDPDLYCDYYMYFTEVYLAAKMRGYVDQIVVLIDAEGISSANFDFSITKRNLNDLLRLCPERQFKMIGVHVGHFGYLCWNFIKPILPKRTQEKIVVASDDPREMYATLLEEMPKHVIPTYLGGKNTHC